MAGGTGLSRKPRTSSRQHNRLRIIGGRWRGRKLSFPDIEGLRPTPDRVRETLFNWLQDDIQDAHCLDLFAGSGALGLEALSRGAACVLMCDNNPLVVKQIRNHLETLQARGGKVVQSAALDLLQHGTADTRYNIIFLDPPFSQGLLAPCILSLEIQGWLAENARIYLESESSLGTLALPENWEIIREKTAGQVTYRLIARTSPVQAQVNPPELNS